MSNAVKIKKVKLRKNDSLQGVVVTYEKPSKNKDYNQRDEHRSTFKTPVQKEVLSWLEALRPHAESILRLDAGKDNVRVVGVTSDGDTSFVLIVVVNTFGNKEYEVSTPVYVNDSGYEKFADVIKTILDLYKEVNVYMKDGKAMDKKQLAFAFAQRDAEKNPDFDPESVKDMNDEQLTAFCKNHLENKKGAVIIMEEKSDSDEAFGTEGGGENGKAVPINQTTTDTKKAAAN